MFLVLAVISLILADLFKFGLDYKSGILIAFIDSVNHCIIYRKRSEPIRPQTWPQIISVNVVLKRTCGLTACLLRGQIPLLERNFWQIMTVISSLAVVYALPKDPFYINLKKPVCKFFVTLGCGLYRQRKLLYSLNLISKLDQESLTLNPIILGMCTAILLCDGGSMARNVDFWLLELRQKKRVNVAMTLRRLIPFIVKRTLPTCAIYFACAQLRVLETSGNPQTMVRILNLLHAFYCQDIHGQIQQGLRHWSSSRAITNKKEDIADVPIASTDVTSGSSSNASSDEDTGLQQDNLDTNVNNLGEDTTDASQSSGSSCPFNERQELLAHDERPPNVNHKAKRSGILVHIISPPAADTRGSPSYPCTASDGGNDDFYSISPSLRRRRLVPHTRCSGKYDDSPSGTDEEGVEAVRKYGTMETEKLRMHPSPSFNSSMSTSSGNDEGLSLTPRKRRSQNAAIDPCDLGDF